MPTENKPKPRLTPRPVQKRLSMALVLQWLPEDKRFGITPHEIYHMVGNKYCASLVNRGFCPEDCNLCELQILDCFRELDKARNAEAVASYRLKDHAARMAEMVSEQRQRQSQLPALESPQDVYNALFPDRRGEVNLFEELAKQYDPERGRNLLRK